MDNILPWFCLKSVPGVGNLLGKRLIDTFKSAHEVFQASDEALLRVDGITVRHVAALKANKIPEGVVAELDLVARRGYHIVTLTDPDYPKLLRQIPDPPLFLYACGRLESSRAKIAVVGSRNATGYGVTTTKSLSSTLASLGLTIVSGMARGIDTAAHEGALGVGAKTIAVLGSGLERIYPAENKQLFHRISERGAVVSEFPLMTGPEAHNFPIRNRIISGMSLGTVVVEASKNSGSLITARLAAEQNREVFAVPGSIQSFKSIGTHTLIKQGAKLVEHAQDIIEELTPIIRLDKRPARLNPNRVEEIKIELTDEESRVFEALGPYPIHIDDLVRKISMGPGKLSSILLQLELAGLVRQSPGKYFNVSPKP
ncbi:MAG: DNA-processing protein DprA [Desulfobacterales bacterium]|nr:MAG: DNA-processing protein DprA [Desulfobacterales bacterium]